MSDNDLVTSEASREKARGIRAKIAAALFETAPGDRCVHDVIDEHVAQALDERARECAEICAAEERQRLQNSEAARNGSWEWGDPAQSEMAQAHKAITAGALAAEILSRFSLKPKDQP